MEAFLFLMMGDEQVALVRKMMVGRGGVWAFANFGDQTAANFEFAY